MFLLTILLTLLQQNTFYFRFDRMENPLKILDTSKITIKGNKFGNLTENWLELYSKYDITKKISKNFCHTGQKILVAIFDGDTHKNTLNVCELIDNSINREGKSSSTIWAVLVIIFIITFMLMLFFALRHL